VPPITSVMAITEESASSEEAIAEEQRRALLEAALAVIEPEITRVLERIRSICRRRVVGQA
jgi:hypothetical protein